MLACLVTMLFLSALKAPVSRMEGVLTDFRNSVWMVLYGPQEGEPPSPVTVVDVDERTLEAAGLYGETYRGYHAKIVDFLSRNGAGAIVFDFLFKTSDSGRAAIADYKAKLGLIGVGQSFDTTTWNKLRSELDVSRKLERSVAQAPRAVVAAQLGDHLDYPNPSDWIPKASLSWQQRIWTGIPLSGQDLSRLRGQNTLDNVYPALAAAATRMGLANTEPDPDGKVRRLQLLWRFPDTAFVDPVLAPEGSAKPAAYPVLALQASMLMLGLDPRSIRIEGDDLVLGAPVRIWRDQSGHLRTSAPGLTWAMCEDLRASKSKLDSLAANRTGIVVPTFDVVVARDQSGRFSTRLAYPDSLGDDATRVLAGLAPDTSWLGQIPSDGSPAALSDSLGIMRVDGGYRFIKPESDGTTKELAFMSERAMRIFLAQFPAEAPSGLEAILPGRNAFLSVWTETWWDRSRRRLATSILPLRGSSLTALLDLPDDQILSLKTGDTLHLGDPVRIPMDARGAMLLPYSAPSRWEGRKGDQAWIRHVSYLDFLQGRYDPGQIPGRVFVLGSSANALSDFVDVPIERRHPGVDIQAMGIHDILSGDFLRIAPQWTDFVLTLGLALVAGLATSLLAPGWAMGAVGILLVGWFAGSVVAFDRGWWIGILPGVMSTLAATIAVMGMRYVLEEKQRVFLQKSFKTYISPDLIDQMVASGMQPRLGGEAREITAFFTDIQGFSTFSEKIGSPARLVELINEYLSAMTKILTDNQGTLDKYIGDAIVAMYGAPVGLEDHARRATLSAVLMQERLAELRKKWQDEGDKWPEIVHQMRMRIGLNTGLIVTGNMGSDLRMNYTMMGDDVNLAARLESASKQYGVFILSSEATISAAGPGFVSREIDKIRVMGKSEPVVVHEIVGREESAPRRWLECMDAFAKARALYVAGDFAKAREGFLASLQLEPFYGEPGVKTCPSKVFASRCEQLAAHPPENWDAIFTATSK
jgi:adenylate cyclase